ncbi:MULTISPECIES: PsiF family protein [Caballeronia]|nr:PsiF family protein [Caballeronia grimmiae]MDR5731973.1 PsiF family protein [Caballeronia sp. LZ025]
MTQQQRMTACNTQATGKSGDDRKAFMKSCLSNKG